MYECLQKRYGFNCRSLDQIVFNLEEPGTVDDALVATALICRAAAAAWATDAKVRPPMIAICGNKLDKVRPGPTDAQLLALRARFENIVLATPALTADCFSFRVGSTGGAGGELAMATFNWLVIKCCMQWPSLAKHRERHLRNIQAAQDLAHLAEKGGSAGRGCKCAMM